METISIDILNPKARKIINDLADLNLISIRDRDSIRTFGSILTRLRGKRKSISLDAITKEVELVRSKRYAEKG